MTQHTPGPWYLHVFSDCPPMVIRGASGGFEVRDSDTDRRLADARLLAAAPDLLAALQQLIKWGESEIHNEYDGTSMLLDRLAELDFARAAIAKATGQ